MPLIFAYKDCNNSLRRPKTLWDLLRFFFMKLSFQAASLLLLMSACNPFVYKYDVYPEVANPVKDEAVHALNSLEWWYYTGHLYDLDSNAYGVEYVFFHYTTFPKKDNYLINIAISDPQNEAFYYDYEFFRTRNPTEAGVTPLDLSKGTYNLQGHMGRYRLSGDMQRHPAGINLETIPLKDVVLQDGTGYEKYGDLAVAGYYSFPRLDTKGYIYINGDTIAVSGELWYDRQWNCGNKLLSPKVSWDWLSIHFNERDEELMVYNVEDRRSEIILFGGSYHGADGLVQDLGDGDIFMTPLEYWESPESGRNYPTKWKVEVPKIAADLIVEALYPHQELVLKRMGLKLPYWEGMCKVSGTINDKEIKGNAYLEMTNKPRVEKSKSDQ